MGEKTGEAGGRRAWVQEGGICQRRREKSQQWMGLAGYQHSPKENFTEGRGLLSSGPRGRGNCQD